MARNGLMHRAIKVFGVLAVMVLAVSLLLACGEEEDIDGNGGLGSDPPVATNTPNTGEPPTATPEEPTATPEQPTATPEPEEPTATPEPAGPVIDYPRGEDDLVLRIEYRGGFVMMEHLLTRTPIISLTGDGCFVTTGPQIAIFPAPALPNLLEACVDEDGMQAILQAAKDAGLLEGSAQYPVATIADVPWTVFTINADGKSHVVSAYALSDDPMIPGVSEDDAEARAKLWEFMQLMAYPVDWLPEGSVVVEERFLEIDRLQVVVQPIGSPSAPQPDPSIKPGEIAWPLETPLAEFGDLFLGNQDLRCGVVEGEDLGLLLRVAEDANMQTNWTSEGESYYLYLRPLLAAEDGCSEDIIG